jgi:DNA repair protein RadC
LQFLQPLHASLGKLTARDRARILQVESGVDAETGTEGPRERLERLGLTAMSDIELLAMVLGHGAAKRSARQLAHTLLDAAAGPHGLMRMTRDEFCRVPGIGAAQASRVLAGIELGRRTLTRRSADRPQFRLPKDAAEHLLPRYGAHPVERFGVLLVDTKHRLLRSHIISEGSLDTSLAHPREVYRAAVAGGAGGVIVFHNHPSGDPSPSPADHLLTQRLAKAGTLLGIPLVDHLVLADGGYWSFREHGLI